MCHYGDNRMRLILIAAFTLLAVGQENSGSRYFTNTVLVDQDTVERRFYTDLIQDKVVVINVMFGSCKDSCPVMARNFARIQEWLGPRLGRDVNMISITVDPETDTPARLKSYAGDFKARKGWYFLSGDPRNVHLILQKLGLDVANKQDHLNVFLIGNDRTGLWKKALGIADSEKLIQVVSSVLGDG